MSHTNMSDVDEKLAVQHEESLGTQGVPQFDPVVVKRIVRKIDIFLVPLVTLLFLLNFIGEP